MYYGAPCAFADRRAYLTDDQDWPRLYPLENENMQFHCGKFFRDGKMHGDAIDKRYKSIFSEDVTTKPNEYDIQNASGVLTTLGNMPLFEKYVPNS